MKLAHALLAALKDHGAGEIFGIPGDFALPFFAEIEASNILPLYTLSHEPAVGFAADAAARYRHSLGVACITYGAGALNMVNPIATAYAEKSPLVVISGAPGKGEGAGGMGLHHQVKRLDSQFQIMREVTCAQCVLDDPATAPAEIARVLHAALVRSRPVYIELPRDMVSAEVSSVEPIESEPPNREAAEACARAVMRRLREAKNPALLLGVEVRRYGIEAEVAVLAARLRIPAATSFMARGVAADTDAPILGTYLGLAGDESLRETIETSDALLMLGVIMADTNFGVSAEQIDARNSIHAFDGAVSFGHHVFPDVTLAALVEALNALAEPLGERTRTDPSPKPGDWIPDDTALVPQDVAEAVNLLFARHGTMPIASDMGDCLFTAMGMTYTELAAPGYYATMGTGIPFGFGIEAASGRRPLVLVGDGAFQMTGWELGNANRLGLKPIVLVFDNSAWGMLKVFQPGKAYNDLDDWPFAKLAENLGGIGHRATTRRELADALAAAHGDEGRWHLIQIRLPQDEYSPTLTRFVEAQRRRSVLGNAS